MNTVAIIQARMTSTRLPGKVLMKIAGKPMLWHLAQRTQWAKHINKVVVATSIDSSDKPIVDFCKKHKFDYFRGDLENVLSRYYHCARKYNADIIVRITADCPLIDGTLIGKGLAIFKKSKVDYLSNTIKRSFPRGLDFEIFTFAALEKAFKNAKSKPEREHVTPYIELFHKKNGFRIKNILRKQNKSSYRLTVDTTEDFELIKTLMEKYRSDQLGIDKIIRILDNHPKLVWVNRHIQQKRYGYQKKF